MSAECFIDTNLFTYQLEASDERKAATADRIIRKGIETRNACISIQECLNTVLRKAEIPLSTDETKQYLDNVLAPLYRVPASLSLYRLALDLQTRYRRGFYDFADHRIRPRRRLHPALQRGLAGRAADRRTNHREPVF